MILLITFAAVIGLGGTAGATGSSDGSDRARPRPPRVEVQQDGRMLEVTWHRMERSGATKLGYRLRGRDREFKIKGSTEQPQLKLVLAEGERYRLSVRAYYPNRGWSRWGTVRVEAPNVDAHPWTVQAQAGDGSLELSWADVEADSYRYRVWSGRRLIRSGSTDGTAVTVGSLDNDRTYEVTVRARYGHRFTNRTPKLKVTPNDGKPASVALRNYLTEPPTGPIEQVIPTAVSGAAERVASMTLTVAPTNRNRTTYDTSFDPAAVATTDIEGAWVTPTVTVEALDLELVSEARSAEGEVLASSLQTWLLGPVDEFAPGATPETRIGTYR